MQAIHYTGKEIYERLVEAAQSLYTEDNVADVTAEAVEAKAGLEAGSFDRFFDSMPELIGVVLDRTVKRIMEDCARILEGDGSAAQRVEDMFGCWSAQVGKINALRGAADEIPAMKGHILTCLDLYTRLSEALCKLLQDAEAEGQCSVREPAFAGRSLAFGLLASRYSDADEEKLMNMVRSALEDMLFAEQTVDVARAS